MWLGLLKFGFKTGAEIYKNKKETKILESVAEKKQMQRVIDGEIEMVKTIKEHQANDWKDEIVLVLISIPLLVCAYGIFSEDPEIIAKLDAFFDQIDRFPFWLQGLIIGGYSSVLGIKGVSAFKKKQYYVQMDKIKVDAVITDLELQLETHNNSLGSYVNFRFIDIFPNFPKVNDMIAQIKKRHDVDLINYEYSYTGINEKTDLKYFDITLNQGGTNKKRAIKPPQQIIKAT